jgi:hypothetical protein
MTVHRNKYLLNKTKKTHAFLKLYFGKNLYMFGEFPFPINRSFLLNTRQWYISCGFDNRFQAGAGWNCLQFQPDPALKGKGDS